MHDSGDTAPWDDIMVVVDCHRLAARFEPRGGWPTLVVIILANFHEVLMYFSDYGMGVQYVTLNLGNDIAGFHDIVTDIGRNG